MHITSTNAFHSDTRNWMFFLRVRQFHRGDDETGATNNHAQENSKRNVVVELSFKKLNKIYEIINSTKQRTYQVLVVGIARAPLLSRCSLIEWHLRLTLTANMANTLKRSHCSTTKSKHISASLVTPLLFQLSYMSLGLFSISGFGR